MKPGPLPCKRHFWRVRTLIPKRSEASFSVKSRDMSIVSRKMRAEITRAGAKQQQPRHVSKLDWLLLAMSARPTERLRGVSRWPDSGHLPEVLKGTRRLGQDGGDFARNGKTGQTFDPRELASRVDLQEHESVIGSPDQVYGTERKP